MNTLPLLPDAVSDRVIAYRDSLAVTQTEFLCHVLSLAGQLPETRHALNLCRDRYWFTVSLFAAISRGILSVLPNSTAPENITAVCTEIPDIICLSDQTRSVAYPMPCIQVSETIGTPSDANPVMPQIPFDQAVAWVYTSGSTGKPQRHLKTFGHIQQCADAEAERVWRVTGGPCAVLGTVPFQHMYGLESTILLPILGGGQLSARLPFYPADISAGLAALPMPRLLVTTPFHLRKLLEANIDLPPLAAVLSATAPLSEALAHETENRLNAPILEIYGSTETGQIATRQPTQQVEWDTYSNIALQQEQNGVTVTGGHLESPQRLNDVVDLINPHRFRLLGRNSDMINIAGKRSSLAYLNHILNSLPGISDGVFFLPDEHSNQQITRLSAFVVAANLTANDVLVALRLHLDPAFLPRPVVLLDALPRDRNGKIAAAALASLIAEHFPKQP